MTWKELKDKLANVPDDTPVFIKRSVCRSYMPGDVESVTSAEVTKSWPSGSKEDPDPGIDIVLLTKKEI